MTRVLLVLMPWANPSFPSLALGLLNPLLKREGIECETLHANVIGAHRLDDPETYDGFSTDLASELVFSAHYYDLDRDATAARLAEHLSRGELSPSGEQGFFAGILDWAGALLDELVATVNWERVDVVGFSVTFQQTAASLALVRRVKACHPHVRVLFGGASCDGDMGPEMLRAFPEIDYVYVGEADQQIAAAIREIAGRDDPGAPVLTPGLAARAPDGTVIATGTAPFTRDLDALPVPDFEEYFALLERLGNSWINPRLYVEHSRGCWYGEHRACSFCGLAEMTYRRKSADRARDEILELARAHRITDFYMSDNILDFRYFKDLLPELAHLRHDDGMDLTLFYELKSNLSEKHVQMLAAAGVSIVQIGIESFEDHVLKLMRKGSTALRQVQSLKHLYGHGIHSVWNIIYGNPGEVAEDYARMAALFDDLDCLPPPEIGHVGPMMLQRFSRYWRDPDNWNVTGIHPKPLYAEIFPSESIDHSQLACFFDYHHEHQRDEELAAAQDEMVQAIVRWRERFVPYSLVFVQGGSWVKVIDRRVTNGADGSPVTTVLRGPEADVLLYCDWSKGFRKLRNRYAGREDELNEALDNLMSRRLLIRDANDTYLSLPIRSRRQSLA